MPLTDTHPRVLQMQIELLRNAGFERRLALALGLSRTVTELSRRGIAERTGASEREVRLRLAELIYGRALIDRVRHHLVESTA